MGFSLYQADGVSKKELEKMNSKKERKEGEKENSQNHLDSHKIS
jgi:hypothetical protein